MPGKRARHWGRIVNLSSVAAQVGGVVGPHYAASKAGVLGLTRYYASHLAREGIQVNAIAPALVETEMVTSNPNATADRIPVGRYGSVDEVAAAAVMLGAQRLYNRTDHQRKWWLVHDLSAWSVSPEPGISKEETTPRRRIPVRRCIPGFSGREPGERGWRLAAEPA